MLGIGVSIVILSAISVAVKVGHQIKLQCSEVSMGSDGGVNSISGVSFDHHFACLMNRFDACSFPFSFSIYTNGTHLMVGRSIDWDLQVRIKL